MLTIMFFVQLV